MDPNTEHKKDFDLWSKKKKSINSRSHLPVIKEREIWWCSLGCNIGSEEDGKHENFLRPVIIFRIFDESILWAIPLTTRNWPKASQIHHTFTLNGITRAAEIHQVRPISSKRLSRYIDTISFEDFQTIRFMLKGLA